MIAPWQARRRGAGPVPHLHPGPPVWLHPPALQAQRAGERGQGGVWRGLATRQGWEMGGERPAAWRCSAQAARGPSCCTFTLLPLSPCFHQVTPPQAPEGYITDAEVGPPCQGQLAPHDRLAPHASLHTCPLACSARCLPFALQLLPDADEGPATEADKRFLQVGPGVGYCL